jgi:gamma-glutamylcyclotransferase (GGCT)/AIG2-like uncharacterized protein YtfP
VVLPVLDLTIETLLARPSCKLASYGTLRPGQPNEHVVAVPGQWADITLTGWLHDESGFPAFTFDVAGKPVPAALFASDLLPTLWQALDNFEGPGYDRRLGVYERDGTIGVANVYEWAGGSS